MLEEMGFANSSQDSSNRKLYAATPEGEKFLADNKPQVDAIFGRFEARDEEDGRAGYGSLFRAMMNLRAAVKLRARGASTKQIGEIVDALDDAAKKIERL